MSNPFPIEFVDEGDTITIRLEEWAGRRTIHMTDDNETVNRSPSLAGYSVGRWEGSTLIVTTTGMIYPYFDDRGTPMSENMQVVERFAPSDDESLLSWEATVTDLDTLKA